MHLSTAKAVLPPPVTSSPLFWQFLPSSQPFSWQESPQKRKKHRPDSWHSAPQRSLWALSLPTSSFPFLSEVPSLPSVCFFIVLIGYWYGAKTGILVGFVYGIMQFLQEPYVLSLFQVCCDYLLAFAALGLGGFFRNKKHGLFKGYLVAILMRGAFHALGGYLYWMDYMPDEFPKAISFLYPIVYNYSYILAEGVLTVILLSIPAVKKALEQVRQLALS